MMNWLPKIGEKVKAHNGGIKTPPVVAVYVGSEKGRVYPHVTSVKGKKVRFRFVEKL